MRIFLIGNEALARDVFMQVDDIDADLTRVCWSYNAVTGYAVGQWPRGGSNRPRHAARIILERVLGRRLERQERVDHINHDKLDNRRGNLRLATHQQNKWNVPKQKHRDGRPTSSQYKGVSLFKRNGRWTASIKVNDKSVRLGYFDTEEDAARAYDAAARQYFGEFAYCNFPAIDTLGRDPVHGDVVLLTTDEITALANRPPLTDTPLVFT